MIAVTVTVAVPLCDSEVAVMVVVPVPTPVTSPVDETLPTSAFELSHVTTRLVSAAPELSRTVAESCTVLPSGMLEEVGAMDTDATATSVTVTARAAESSPVEAVIVAVPGDTPVTSPTASTEATVVRELLQVTDAFPTGWPTESAGIAVTLMRFPTRMVADNGLRMILTTLPADKMISDAHDDVETHNATSKMPRAALEIARMVYLLLGSTFCGSAGAACSREC